MVKDKKELLINLSILFFGIIIFFVISEVGLRFIESWGALKQECGFQRDPSIGYVNEIGYRGEFNRPEYTTPITINECGLRGIGCFEENSSQIVVLGDSMTFGDGLRAEETWPYLLGIKLNAAGKHIEVLNAGVSGYGTVQELGYYKEFFSAKKKGFTIIAFFLGNDLSDNQLGIPFTADDQGCLISSQFFAHMQQTPSSLIGNTKKESRTIQFMGNKMYRNFITYQLYSNPNTSGIATAIESFIKSRNINVERSRIGYDFNSDIEVATTKKVFLQAKNYFNSKNQPFVVVIMPSNIQQDKSLLMKLAGNNDVNGYDQQNLANYFSNFFSESGIEYFDSTDCLKSYKYTELYYQEDGHFTPKGSSVFATCLYDYVQKNGLVSSIN